MHVKIIKDYSTASCKNGSDGLRMVKDVVAILQQGFYFWQ
jgi:hypothetical protein